MSARRTKRSTKRRAEERVPHSAPGQAEEIERLKRENDQLREKLAERDRQIADLERQLALRRQNSTTSSKPPSSDGLDRKSTRLNSSHVAISYAVFCLK